MEIPKKAPQSSKHSKDKKESNNFIRFSGLAFEMLAFIILGVFVGMKVDAYLNTQKPFATMIGSLLGVVMAMIYVIRKLL